MNYTVIYDGRCNLCVTLVRALEQLDHGQQFRYVPMQDAVTLAQWRMTPADCEAGMILMADADPDSLASPSTSQTQQRWQGSDAAEEIARLLPAGAAVIAAYRWVPGLKELGDQVYAQVRDNRYAWFGGRTETYQSGYPCRPGSNCIVPE
jgi:predicted DCC family thiol-disulfide oxidoreductase YuxK